MRAWLQWGRFNGAALNVEDIMSNTRETRAVAQIPCPRCHAPAGERCRTHHADGKRRMTPMHGPACCQERRAANQERIRLETNAETA
jgi:hypothetical protein